MVAFAQLDSIEFTKLSYKAPYLLLQNPSQAKIFQVSVDASTLTLTPLYQISTPGIDSDIVVYNVKSILIFSQLTLFPQRMRFIIYKWQLQLNVKQILLLLL